MGDARSAAGGGAEERNDAVSDIAVQEVSIAGSADGEENEEYEDATTKDEVAPSATRSKSGQGDDEMGTLIGEPSLLSEKRSNTETKGSTTRAGTRKKREPKPKKN